MNYKINKDTLATNLIIMFIFANSTFHIFKTTIGALTINTQLAAEVIIIISSAIFFIRNNFNIEKKPRNIIVYFSLYVCLATISIFYTNSSFGTEHIGLWLTLIFSFSISVLLRKISFQTLNISNVIIYIGIFQALLSVIQTITGNPIVPKDHANEWLDNSLNRSSGTYRDPIDLAFYLAICIFLVKYQIYSSKKIYKLKTWISLLLFSGIFCTQSLTIFSGMILAYIIFIMFSDIRHKIRHIITLLLAFIILLPITFSLDITKSIPILSSITNRTSAYSDPDDEARGLHMSVGLEILKDSNYIGIGYGMYDTVAPNYVSPDTFMGRKYLAAFKRMNTPTMISHSLPATILAELGLLGILVFSLFYYQIVKLALPTIREKTHFYFFGSSVLSIVTTKFLGYGFRLSDAFLIFIILFTIKLYEHNRKPH